MSRALPSAILGLVSATLLVPLVGSLPLDVGLPDTSRLLPTARPFDGGPDANGATSANPGPAKGGELRFQDGEGDVGVQPGLPGLPTYTEGIDFTGVRVHGETGDFLRISLKVKKLETDRTYENFYGGGVDFTVCFKLNDRLFAAQLATHYTGGIKVINRWVGTVKDQCRPDGITFQKKMPVLGYSFDTTTNEIHLRIPRRSLVGPAPGPLVDGLPASPGDAISNVWAMVRDKRREALRYDAAPNDAPDGGKLALVYPTANLEIVARPTINAPMFFRCGDYQDIFAYAVEAGGKRGVPITIMSLGREPRTVDLNVVTQAGADWKPKMMPSIGVPGAPHEKTTGNVTVNVIIDAPSSAQHKECSTIRVRAFDADRPDRVGETLFNVVAVVPPSPGRNTLYLHAGKLGAGSCQASGGAAWLNVEPSDADEVDRPIYFENCGGVGEGGINVLGFNPALSTYPSLLSVRLDVNPSHDLVLNTSATGKVAKAVLNLKSEHLNTRARITATIFRGYPDGPLGEGTKEVMLGPTPSLVPIDVPIHFTREQFGTGDPSRVVEATTPVGLAIRYQPLPPNDNTPVATAGRVYLVPKGTQVTLPIWSTIKRNAVDAGAAGGLISLHGLSKDLAYANPLGVRVFNFTVLNEAVASDAAVIETLLSGNLTPGWTVQVAPPGPFELEPGESASFAVGVTPPAHARESEAVRVDVTATSQSDPSARSVSSLRVIATRGQEVPGQTLPPLDVGGDDSKGIPAIPFAPVLGLVAGTAWLLRRRRD